MYAALCTNNRTTSLALGDIIVALLWVNTVGTISEAILWKDLDQFIFSL